MSVFDKSRVETGLQRELNSDSENMFGGQLTETVQRTYWREGRFGPGEEGVPEFFEVRNGTAQTNYVSFDWRYQLRWVWPDGTESSREKVYEWRLDRVTIGGALLKKNGEPGLRGVTFSYSTYSPEVLAEQPQWVQALVAKYDPEGTENPFTIGMASSGSKDAVGEEVERDMKLADEVLAKTEGGG